jgi:hypothetical protein
MFVLELPGDVCAAILRSWIDLQALGRMDSALCATISRKQFKQLVGGESFVADTVCTCSMMTFEKYAKHLEWLTNRQIKVRNWIVNWYAESCSQQLMRGVAGPHVRTIQLRRLSPSAMSRVFDTFVNACCGLRELKIVYCSHWETVCTLSVPLQQSLQELVLECCDGDHWESVVQFPNLRKLHIDYLEGNDVQRSLIGLLSASPNLIDLRVNSIFQQRPIGDESLQLLANRVPGLEILELAMEIQEFSPAAVVSLAERCSNLKMLALTCGAGLNDVVVEAFLLHCSRLEGLQLWGTFAAASLSAEAVQWGPRLRYLTIDLCYCEQDCLAVVAEHCRLLEELQLYYCGHLTGESDSLLRLVSSLPHLRELLLECGVVTDEVLIAIASHLPRLTTLGLGGCAGHYTEAGALAVVTSLKHLQWFGIGTDDLSVFTPALLKRWQAASPGLKIFSGCIPSTRYFAQLGF